ncbi:MAG: polymer-forming cytoskeletal protein [Acidobacteriota bacterium]|nr:polymer-forming cytoskeletal protein [Acidobacteriota bacterium]
MDSNSRAEAPSRLPAGLTVTGEITSDADLTIDGTFDGQITVPQQHVTISASAKVNAKIIARDVTIAGKVEGSIAATERVTLAASANVRAHIQTPSIALIEGAQFTGTVDPSRNEAAVHIAKYRQKQA